MVLAPPACLLQYVSNQVRTHGRNRFSPGFCLLTPLLPLSASPSLGWTGLQMKRGGKEYLHHEGKLIPKDLQQQCGLGVVLGTPLFLGMCCCKSSLCLFTSLSPCRVPGWPNSNINIPPYFLCCSSKYWCNVSRAAWFEYWD